MSVRKLKDGRWVCEYYDYSTGTKKAKREYFSRGYEGKCSAEARNHEVKLEKQNIKLKIISPTFGEIAKAYQELKFNRSGGMTESGQKATYYKMKASILPYFGSIQVMDFNSKILDKYVVKRLKSVKATTVHRELTIVRAVINWATEQEPPIIPYNPVGKYKLPKRDDEVIQPPTPNEITRIYNNAPPHLKRFIILTYNTGARPGISEVLSILWSNVDIESNHITIISAKKGGVPIRKIPISKELMEHLSIWKQEDCSFFKCKSRDLSGPIIHYKGNQIKKIKTAWNTTLDRAKIVRRIRPYDLRHAFASYALETGGDLKTVSVLLGHSRPDTILKMYQHVNWSMAKNAISNLPSGLKK